MGSLTEELRTKVMTADAELYLVGCKAFEAGSVHDASCKLASAVRDNEPLLRSLAKFYLEKCVAPDMSGARLKESVRGGHGICVENQTSDATPHGPVEGEDGQPQRADEAGAPVPSFPSPVESGETSVCLPSGRAANALPFSSSSTVRGGVSQPDYTESHASDARLAAKPKPKLPPPRRGEPRRLDAIALAQHPADQKLFDTFKVRGGIPIGNLTVFEARKIASTNEREARILMALCDHVGGHTEPGTVLRDCIRPEVLARALAQNKEMSDVT